MKKSNNRNLLIGLLCLIVVAAIFIFAYIYMKPQPAVKSSTSSTTASTISKTITFEVKDADGKLIKSFDIETTEDFLRKALEQNSEIGMKGDEGQYGLFVKELCGIKADDSKKERWAFSKNGEMLNTGVDSTPINNGDKFEATLTVGY